MKVFLTFLALVIVNVNAMIFHDDLRACRGLQNLLDTAAENCAQGAAMYFDREDYAEGYLSFDEDEILDCMEHVRQSCLEKAGSQRILQLRMQVYLYNDLGNCIVLEDGAPVKEYSFSFPLTKSAVVSRWEGCLISFLSALLSKYQNVIHARIAVVR